MSTLFVVRHGQASFMSDDYDQLSPLGYQQAETLGHYWVNLGMRFDKVYIGPLKRHQQTEQGVAKIYRAHGLPWLEAEMLPEFKEHEGPEVTDYMLPKLAESEPTIREWMQKGDQRSYLKAYQAVMQKWARQELVLDQFESWQSFRKRVERGIKLIMASTLPRQNVVVFTSGGPVGAAIGLALGLNDEQVMELSWIVRNATYSEFRFSKDRFSLSTFNTLPHFENPKLLTYV